MNGRYAHFNDCIVIVEVESQLLRQPSSIRRRNPRPLAANFSASLRIRSALDGSSFRRSRSARGLHTSRRIYFEDERAAAKRARSSSVVTNGPRLPSSIAARSSSVTSRSSKGASRTARATGSSSSSTMRFTRFPSSAGRASSSLMVSPTTQPDNFTVDIALTIAPRSTPRLRGVSARVAR
jgi:hypothetical protein